MNNQRGQSTVEYLLLLAVIFSLTASVLNSDAMKDLIGEDSKLFSNIAKRVEFAYRHTHQGIDDTTDYGGIHESFYSVEENASRFFVLKETYPGN